MDELLRRVLEDAFPEAQFGHHVWMAGGGGGAEGEEEPTDDGEEEPTDDEGASDTPEGYLSQDKVNDIVAERLKRERAKWKQELAKKEEEAQRKAEEARLEEQEEYRELANERQERITQLEVQVGEIPQYKERIERLEGVLSGYLDHTREELPKPVLSLLENMDLVEQLEWINENADELDIQPRERIPGGPPPRDRGPRELSEEERAERGIDIRSVW